LTKKPILEEEETNSRTALKPQREEPKKKRIQSQKESCVSEPEKKEHRNLGG